MGELRLLEVGPRDGLQSETVPVSTDLKLQFISDLLACGLKQIEATSFVRPDRVPQLADSETLWSRLPSGGLFSALIPNLKGAQRAVECGVKGFALITATSDAFTQANMGMSVADSLAAVRDSVQFIRDSVPGAHLRVYLSTAFECPYAGRISLETSLGAVKSLSELAAEEIAVSDTVGRASPNEVMSLLEAVKADTGLGRIACHFHDTWGTGIANIAAAYEVGVKAFDSSAGGLGGCPYAPGAGGNVATEDVVYFFDREGVETGINLELLAKASLPILEKIGRGPSSKAQLATLARSKA